MSTVTLTLPDETVAVLTAEARDRGLTLAELLEQVVVEYAAPPRTVSDAAFQKAAADTLRKNAELYRRLAAS